MRVLHLVPLHIPASGIIRQAIAESHAAAERGLSWDVRLFTDINLPDAAKPLQVRADTERHDARGAKGFVSYAAAKMRHRRALYRWLLLHEHEYDVILLRYTTSDISRARALRRATTPIVSVHHTLEIPELQLEPGLQGVARVLSETVAGRRNLRAASAIAGVTQEIVDYEAGRAPRSLPTLTFPNGIDTGEQPLAGDARSNDVPELLFVASHFSSWHGLDLLLAGLGAVAEEFRLHLVGNVEDADKKVAMSDPRVVLHGHLTQDEMAPLLARAWVGLSSFALERKGMREACTLKVREYLASGIATFSGHRDRFPSDAAYYRAGEANLPDILEFAKRARRYSREEVRNMALPLIDKAQILVDTQAVLKNTFGPRRSN